MVQHRRDDERAPAKRGAFRSKDSDDDDAPRKRYDKPEDGGFQRKDGAERGAARKPAPRSSGWDDEAEFTRPESNRGRSYD
ncbi:MAG: hypothetical protein ACKO6O_08445, partial [Acidimicrobiaceae bacterium]